MKKRNQKRHPAHEKKAFRFMVRMLEYGYITLPSNISLNIYLVIVLF